MHHVSIARLSVDGHLDWVRAFATVTQEAIDTNEQVSAGGYSVPWAHARSGSDDSFTFS